MSRQALFNRLSARTDIEGSVVVDLFAGSGSLGIEALSRGAGKVTFVDSSGLALKSITSNLAMLGEEDVSTVIKSDAVRYLENTSERPDIILADPPYDYPALDRLIELSYRILAAGGYLVVEHDGAYSFDDLEGFVTSGTYGRTKLTFFGSD
jgi:16S rRNA (guanine(966)-N(2))-methyltransferase RsmD